MVGHVLRKGANVSLLSRRDPSARLQAVVRWANPRGAADVDVAALLLSSDGRVRSDEDFVFYNSPSGGDGSVRLLGKRADDETGTSVRFDVDGVGPETAIVLGELYSRGDEWKFRAVGQGWDTGLAGLATDFGIAVEAEPADDAPPSDGALVHEVPPVVAPPAEEPPADLVEVPVDDIGVDELITGESWSTTEVAAEPARPQRGW